MLKFIFTMLFMIPLSLDKRGFWWNMYMYLFMMMMFMFTGSFSHTIFMWMLLSFFSAVYSLYLYLFIQHGEIYSGMYNFNLGYLREYLLLFLHWFPLNLLILKSSFF